MKTVLMAGGRGTRISSIVSDIPKPMIEMGEKPVLEWEIECLRNQGFTDLIITVSHLAEKITSYFGNGSEWDVKIDYYYEEKPYGNAGAIFKLWEKGILYDDFLLLIADAMFDIDFSRFVAFHKSHNALATLFTHPNSHPFDSGVVVADEESHIVTGWLTKEDKRPQYYKNRVNAGLHILSPDILTLSRIDPASVGNDKRVDLDRDILKPLVCSHSIYAYDSPEYVKDMGTPERFQAVTNDLTSGKVHARNLNQKQKAIFLDRDGTINKYVGFLRDIESFELLPGVAEAIRLINESAFLAIVVTNQPVIARGEVSVECLESIHNKMETVLGETGAYIDGLYYCPHHPDKGFIGEIPELKTDCNCRKPKSGMLLKAAEKYNIDLESSWMIGDGWRDIEAGKSAGCKTIFLNGGGSESDVNGKILSTKSKDADYVESDLLSAVRLVLIR